MCQALAQREHKVSWKLLYYELPAPHPLLIYLLTSFNCNNPKFFPFRPNSIVWFSPPVVAFGSLLLPCSVSLSSRCEGIYSVSILFHLSDTLTMVPSSSSIPWEIEWLSSLKLYCIPGSNGTLQVPLAREVTSVRSVLEVVWELLWVRWYQWSPF